jgi:hypothetical protein
MYYEEEVGIQNLETIDRVLLLSRFCYCIHFVISRLYWRMNGNGNGGKNFDIVVIIVVASFCSLATTIQKK